MKNALVSPDNSASTQDWHAWLEELQEMPQTAAVRQAAKRAEQVLNTRKRQTIASHHSAHLPAH